MRWFEPFTILTTTLCWAAIAGAEVPSAEPAPRSSGCDLAQSKENRISCERRELDALKSEHTALVESCGKMLPSSLRSELTAQEKMWKMELGGECADADCVASAIHQRDHAIIGAFPQCGAPNRASDTENEIPDNKSGMLPARWLPAEGPGQDVPFHFESKTSTEGTMSTKLGGAGEQFHGRYVRLEEASKGEVVTTIYDGWSGPQWEVWQHDANGNWTAAATSIGGFARFYSGKVVAILAGDRGSSMRCQMSLKEPQVGLAGGGEGNCQISSGGLLRLVF